MGTRRPVRSRALQRGDVLAGAGRLPREACAVAAERPGRGQRRRQSAQPVLEHGPGRRRVRGGQERQHEGVHVPEDVPAVPRSGQATRSDRHLAGVAHRPHQVEEGEPDGGLQPARPPRWSHRNVPSGRAQARRWDASSRSKPTPACPNGRGGDHVRCRGCIAPGPEGHHTVDDHPARRRAGIPGPAHAAGLHSGGGDAPRCAGHPHPPRPGQQSRLDAVGVAWRPDRWPGAVPGRHVGPEDRSSGPVQGQEPDAGRRRTVPTRSARGPGPTADRGAGSPVSPAGTDPAGTPPAR